MLTSKFVFKKQVIKPIFCGFSETNCGSDVFNVFHITRMRNILPIQSVNSYRELNVYKLLPFEWNPVTDVKKVFTNNRSWKEKDNRNFEDLIQQRTKPSKVYWVYYRNHGIPIKCFMFRNNSFSSSNYIVKEVSDRIMDMNKSGIVHGNLNASNVCIDENGKIFFINFNWCMHKDMDMSCEENEYYEKCLEANFDLNYFLSSFQVEDKSNENSVPW
jgi:hypothetical protein